VCTRTAERCSSRGCVPPPLIVRGPAAGPEAAARRCGPRSRWTMTRVYSEELRPPGAVSLPKRGSTSGATVGGNAALRSAWAQRCAPCACSRADAEFDPSRMGGAGAASPEPPVRARRLRAPKRRPSRSQTKP
jgi:hypothetical protein